MQFVLHRPCILTYLIGCYLKRSVYAQVFFAIVMMHLGSFVTNSIDTASV